MAHRLQYRRDTKANWLKYNPVLMEGEVGYETDTHHQKVGDGVSKYSELEYEVGVGNITQETGDSESLVMSQKAVTEVIGELEQDIYSWSSKLLEIGTYYPDTNSYDDKLLTRVRTKKDAYFSLLAGDVISLTDYTIAKLRIARFVNGVYINYSSWLTQDYVCPSDGEYKLSILSVPEVVQTDVNTLGGLLRIESKKSFDSVRNIVFDKPWEEQRFDTTVEFKPKDSLYYAIGVGIKIGDDVNNVISNPESSSNYKSIVIRCSDFDSFKLSYFHGSALSWMFTDKDGYVTGIDATPVATEIIDAVIEVPTGSDKLYFQTYERSNLNPCIHYVKGNIRAVDELKRWSEETFIKYEGALEVIKQENIPTIDGKNWTTRILYTAKEDEIVDVEMVLSDDCYVRDEYQAPGTSYSTYGLFVYSGENRKATLISEIGNRALNNKTKKAENVQLQAGDTLVYGDRIVGMYTKISVKVNKNIVNAISDNIADIKELEAKIKELEAGDFTEKQSGYVHAQTYTQKRLCLAHFSDIHMSTLGLQRFNEWCSLINANSLFIKDKLITGDYVYAWDDTMAWWDTNGGSNILGCIGNHEIQTYIDGDLTRVQKTERIGLDAYNKFIKPYISNWGIVGTVSVNNGTLVYSSSNPTGSDIYKHIDADTEGYSFYFKDYAEPKVRLIVLDWTNYNSPQKQWMQAVLDDAKGKEYSVIVASHFPSKGIIKSNNTFDAFYKNSIAGASDWLNIFTEYDAHADIQNFIDGGGKFVCWLCGHYHLDNWGFLDGYPMQLCIDVASAQVREAEGDIYHLNDTTFNLFSVDTMTEILYVNRIGANKTMYGYNRDCIVWDYKNHRLIREGK